MFRKNKNQSDSKTSFRTARTHHHLFAHTVLPAFCENEPAKFFSAMGSNEKDKLIAFLWDYVCEIADEPIPTDMSASDIKASTFRLQKYPTVFVEMPEAQGISEAIFIAIVLTSRPTAENRAAPIEHRYFVLEQGMNLDGTPRTFLCAWQDGRHINMGDDCPPNKKAFLELITTKI